MQISALYRRGIVRPLNAVAVAQLSIFWIETSIRAEWLAILDDNHFERIWESGVLQSINAACGLEISNYEEVVLEVGQLKGALTAIRNQPEFQDSLVSTFVHALEGMILDAIESKMPLFFVL